MCVEGKRVLESGNKGDFPLTRLLARMGEGGGRFPACTFTWARISMFARMSEREERERGGGRHSSPVAGPIAIGGPLHLQLAA
jgi:hypothetical protein